MLIILNNNQSLNNPELFASLYLKLHRVVVSSSSARQTWVVRETSVQLGHAQYFLV